MSSVRQNRATMPIPLRTLVFPWVEVARHLFRPLLARTDGNPYLQLLWLWVAAVVTWFVSVPVHELLHVAGCVLFGGSVSELTIQPMYGGHLLARVFPFVVTGGDYAGQLTGFDTGGSDVCYFATDFFPFILSIFLGVPMLVIAHVRRNVVAHAIGLVQTLMPVVSLVGDYYEMGSILMTRAAGLAAGSPTSDAIRGDDFILVLSQVGESAGGTGQAMVAVAFVVGLILCAITLDLSLLAARLVRPSDAAVEQQT